MARDTQGTLTTSSHGGVLGNHPEPDKFQFLVAPSTSNEFNTARLRLIPIACFRIDDVRFKFDSSFVLPETQAEMSAFANLRKTDPRVDDAPISIFGHADPAFQGNFEPGSPTEQSGDEYNKTLSGRRAIAIYALLVRDASLWNSLFTNHFGGDIWGEDSIRIMLDSTEQVSAAGQPAPSTPGSSNPGAADSARNAKVRDIAIDGGQRQQLFLKYMNLICAEVKLDKAKDFLARGAGPDHKGDVQGCSRFNPLLLFSEGKESLFKAAAADQDKNTLSARNSANASNRRVMILIFRKSSRVLPAKWPCPTFKEGPAACKKRFFSDGDQRRSTHLPGEDRLFETTQDTFACRFYQRLSQLSPCENVVPSIRCHLSLLLRSNSGCVPLAKRPYKIFLGDRILQGTTDDEGLVQHGGIAPGEYTLEIDGHQTIVPAIPLFRTRRLHQVGGYFLFPGGSS